MTPSENTLTKWHSSSRLREWTHNRTCTSTADTCGTKVKHESVFYRHIQPNMMSWSYQVPTQQMKTNEVTIKYPKSGKVTLPDCHWSTSSQESQYVSQPWWEFLAPYNHVKWQDNKKTIPANRYCIEVPEPSTKKRFNSNQWPTINQVSSSSIGALVLQNHSKSGLPISCYITLCW